MRDPRPPAAGPAPIDTPGPGAADRRALLEVTLQPDRGGPPVTRVTPAPFATSNGGRRGKERPSAHRPAPRPSPRSRSATTARGSSSSPSSPASATRSATRCAAPCCRPSPARPSPASASTACSTSSPPSRGSRRTSPSIILNLKELVVSSEHDEPVVDVPAQAGPGDVTAADIAPPAGVEVHNPDLHLATLNAKGKLEIELVVERGRGYVSAAAEQAPRPGDRPDPGRLDLLAGAQGHLQGRGHPRRAAHRLRPAGPRRRDQAVASPRGTRWPRPARRWSSCSGWPAS